MMIAKIKPSIAKGIVKAPPSKSYAHRLLIAAALAGESFVHNVDLSKDIIATFDSLRAGGFDLYFKNNSVFAGSNTTENKIAAFDARESGSTLRFLIPLMASRFNETTFIGSDKLFSRGLSVYESIFKAQGIKTKLTNNVFSVKGRLHNGTFDVPGNISSQYITGLLFTLPTLDGDSVIRVLGEVESEPYINVTLDVLKQFGIVISKIGHSYYVKGNQKYKPQEVEVEGDYSNAAFLDAFNCLGGEVKVIGLNENSLQGDKVYKEYFKQIQEGHPTIDISNCIDLGPILFTLASMFNGAIFTGTHRLRIKESDRVNDLLDVLEQFGVSSKVEENRVEIYKSELRPVNETIALPNDHRIVMSIALLLSKLGGSVSGYDAVGKSFPRFFDVIKELGIEVSYENVK